MKQKRTLEHKYLGIDIHKQHTQVAVMNESGEIVEEVRVLDANLDTAVR